MQKSALYFAAAFFAVGSLGHILRLLLAFEITVAGIQIPVWFSVPAAIIAAAIALWMARAAKGGDAGGQARAE